MSPPPYGRVPCYCSSAAPVTCESSPRDASRAASRAQLNITTDPSGKNDLFLTRTLVKSFLGQSWRAAPPAQRGPYPNTYLGQSWRAAPPAQRGPELVTGSQLHSAAES